MHAGELGQGEDFCRQAREMGADIALFPEMWNIGYTFEGNWKECAIDQQSAFILHYQNLAKDLNMAIAITYLEKNLRNTVSLIDRHGEIMLTYAKVHTCDFSVESELISGNDFFVCDLDTKQGNVKIGAMICYDREFPESARVLMLKGAEVILVPNACELEQNRIAQLRSRAFENMVGIAVTNYAPPKANGHSIAFDGMAFDKKDGRSRDQLIIEGDEREEIVIAEFDLEALRAYRAREPWGKACRKPKCYRQLLEK